MNAARVRAAGAVGVVAQVVDVELTNSQYYVYVLRMIDVVFKLQS